MVDTSKSIDNLWECVLQAMRWNSTYYSALPTPIADDCPLPPVVIMIPVYKV